MKNFIKRLPAIGALAKHVRRNWVKQTPENFAGSGNYWEARYAAEGTSGVGSYGKFAAFKAEVLNAFVEQHEIDSVLEFGCGDGNQLELARYPNYVGLDVSQSAVERCRRLFAGDRNKSFFVVSEYGGEKADLVLSLDVIFHLVEDDVFEHYIRKVFASASRYVIIYSSNYDDASGSDGVHVRHRKFSDWVLRNCPLWSLLEHVPNRYPYHGDNREGSFADFFIYRKVEP